MFHLLHKVTFLLSNWQIVIALTECQAGRGQRSNTSKYVRNKYTPVALFKLSNHKYTRWTCNKCQTCHISPWDAMRGPLERDVKNVKSNESLMSKSRPQHPSRPPSRRRRPTGAWAAVSRRVRPVPTSHLSTKPSINSRFYFHALCMTCRIYLNEALPGLLLLLLLLELPCFHLECWALT